MGEENVNVFVRVRPLNPKEQAEGSTGIVHVDRGQGTVEVADAPHMQQQQSGRRHSWTFDGVFGSDSTQREVYATGAYRIVESVLEGINGTIFAYGQTSSGKTFTMTGDLEREELRGVSTNAVHHIFEAIGRSSGAGEEYLVVVSYLEIYCEAITDLLATGPEASRNKLRLRLRQGGRGYVVEGLTTHVARRPEDVLRMVAEGSSRRHVGETAMNRESSRSHSILQIVVEHVSTVVSKTTGAAQRTVRVGKLSLVDLAGSERQKKTMAEGVRLKEATKINLSLMTLGNVISALVENCNGSSCHVPYRDSRLTQLLEDSLGGNARTAMFACVSPASSNADETVSTLRYADRAKSIKNTPKVNEDPKDALLSKMQEEIKRLQEELARSGAAATAAGDDGTGMPSSSFIVGPDPRLLVEAEAAMQEGLTAAEKERERSSAELEAARAEAARHAAARDAAKARLSMLEQNICIGGVNLLDENARQAAELTRAARELEEREAKALQLRHRLLQEREQSLFHEQAFKSLEDEVAAKTAAARELFERIGTMAQELDALKAEHERDRQLLAESVRELESELQLKAIVLESFVPQDMINLLRSCARWDEVAGAWTFLALSRSGSVIAEEAEEESAASLSRSSASKSRRKLAAMPQTSEAPHTGLENVFFSLSSATPSPAISGTVPFSPATSVGGGWHLEEEEEDGDDDANEEGHARAPAQRTRHKIPVGSRALVQHQPSPTAASPPPSRQTEPRRRSIHLGSRL